MTTTRIDLDAATLPQHALSYTDLALASEALRRMGETIPAADTLSIVFARWALMSRTARVCLIAGGK